MNKSEFRQILVELNLLRKVPLSIEKLKQLEEFAWEKEDASTPSVNTNVQ